MLSHNATAFFIFCYVQEEKTVKLFAAVAKLNSAAAEKQRNQENQAAGIHAETEALHLATAAAQEQDNEKNPSAVAAAHKSAAAATVAVTVVAVIAATVAFVKHSVEHIYLHFAEAIGFSIRLISLFLNQSTSQYGFIQKSVTARERELGR